MVLARLVRVACADLDTLSQRRQDWLSLGDPVQRCTAVPIRLGEQILGGIPLSRNHCSQNVTPSSTPQPRHTGSWG